MNNYRKSICHNSTDIEYNAHQAIKDLEEAIKKAQNEKNGKPQCSYRW